MALPLYVQYLPDTRCRAKPQLCPSQPSSPNKKWKLFRFPHFKYEEIERLGNRPKVTRLTSSRTGFELHLTQPQNFLFNPLSSASDFSSHLGHARSYSVECLASLSMPLHSSNPLMWEASVPHPPQGCPVPLCPSSRMYSPPPPLLSVRAASTLNQA